MRFAVMRRRIAAVLAAVLALPVLAVLTATPAYAAGHVEGYVWASQPLTPMYVANSGYEYNSAGEPIVINRNGVGVYTVRFHGLATDGGVAHASAYGSGNGDFCTVDRYAPRGDDQIVMVRCFDGDGLPSDSRFVANVTDQQAAPGHFAYLRSHDPNPAGGWYVPSTQWSYDSTGDEIVVTRLGPGRYTVHLGALLETEGRLAYQGYFRATALGAEPYRCEVLDPVLWDPPVVPVFCYTAAGQLTDARFTLTYANGVNVMGSDTPHVSAIAAPQGPNDPQMLGWSTPGDAPYGERLGVGDYLVYFPQFAVPFGHAMVNVFGGAPHYCSVAAWWSVGGTQVVRVNCWDANAINTPTDVWAFNVSFTR